MAAASATIPVLDERIHAMARRIVDGFDPERVILFGSHARGDARPDSDVDLLVVMPLATSRREQAIRIHAAVAGSGLPKDVIVVTPDEFQRRKDVVGTIEYPAAHEGLVLYERP